MPAKNIGKTLKELRLKSGLTQKQAYEHIGVAQSTFSSWEVGKAEPPNDVFMKLCDLYNVKNILQTFGYDGYKEDGSLQLNIKEIDMVEKYRFISTHSPNGASVVITVLDREYTIAEQMFEKEKHIEELENHQTSKKVMELTEMPRYMNEDNNYVNAAHADDYSNAPDELKQQEEDIMDDENF